MAWRREPPLPATSKPTLVLDMEYTLLCRRSDGVADKRPGVDEFLKCMSELYELVLWTSADEDYATDALSEIDTGVFSHMLSSMSFGLDLGKDLVKLGRGLKNVVMVDDDRDIFPEHVLENVIVIKPYKGGAPDDGVLSRLAEVLEELAGAEEFGPELARLRTAGKLVDIENIDDEEQHDEQSDGEYDELQNEDDSDEDYEEEIEPSDSDDEDYCDDPEEEDNEDEEEEDEGFKKKKKRARENTPPDRGSGSKRKK